MNLWKRIAAALLAVCMVLPFAACGGDTTWVYDYEDIKITSGMYIAFTMNAYSQISQQEDYDSKKGIMDQTIEEKSSKEWIRERAAALADEYVATLRKFDELKLELSESDENDIDNTVESFWSMYGGLYEENGVGMATYRKLIEAQVKRYNVFIKYYGEDGIEEVPVKDLEEHFKENFASINILSMTLKTGDKLSDDDKKKNEDTRKKADEYIKKLNEEDKSFAEVYDEWMHYALGTKHDDKKEEKQEDKDLAKYLTKDSTSPSEKIVKSIFSDVEIEGEAKLLTSDNALYIVKRYDVMKDEKNFEEMRETVLSDIKSDDFTELLKGWAEDVEDPAENNAAYNRYDPKNIHLD